MYLSLPQNCIKIEDGVLTSKLMDFLFLERFNTDSLIIIIIINARAYEPEAKVTQFQRLLSRMRHKSLRLNAIGKVLPDSLNPRG